MSRLMRLWHFSSSVNAFFKRACASIQWGLDVWFLVRPFVYFHTLCVRTAKALVRLRGCSGSPEPSLVVCVISIIISRAGSNVITSSDVLRTNGKSEVPLDHKNTAVICRNSHKKPQILPLDNRIRAQTAINTEFLFPSAFTLYHLKMLLQLGKYSSDENSCPQGIRCRISRYVA